MKFGIAASLLFLFALMTQSETIYVDSTAQGVSTGAAWKDAFTDLQHALKAASDTAEIQVAHGTYYPAEKGGGRNKSFQIRGAMKLLGGYPPGGGVADWKKNPTVLSGDIERDDATAGEPGAKMENNSFRVLYCENGTKARIDGLIIRGGCGMERDSANKQFEGAGAYLVAWDFHSDARCIISHCRFEGNYCRGKGAGLYMKGKNCEIIGCAFVNNICVAGGRAIDMRGAGAFFDGYDLSVDSSDFTGNAASSGAAIGFSGMNIAVRSTSFSENRATGDGGAALYTQCHTCLLSGDRFEKNTAINGQGGAVVFRGRVLTMEKCAATGNGSQGNGGAIDFQGDSCALSHNVFNGNSAGHSGGAVRFLCKSVCMHSCDFYDNAAQAGDGGAAYFEGNRYESGSALFKRNSAQGNGGALSIKTGLAVSDLDSFTNNNVKKGKGGALYFEGNRCECSKSDFSGNRADSGCGGALSLMGKEFDFANAQFSENFADSGGAVYYYHDVGFTGFGKATAYKGMAMVRCAFIGNEASGPGGALYWLGRGSITKSRFERNKAAKGGVICGWHHTTGNRVYFRQRTAEIDSLHGEAEYEANVTGQISGAIFSKNTAGQGAVSFDWPGHFISCAFENNMADKGYIVNGREKRPLLSLCKFTGNRSRGNDTGCSVDQNAKKTNIQ